MDVNQDGLPANPPKSNDWHERGEDLCAAAREGNTVLMQELLAAKVPANAPDYFTNTPLFYAADANHEKACLMLIDAKAKVDAANSWGITPLMRAAGCGHKNICRLLLDANAQIDAKDNSHWTPKTWAVMNNQEEICQLFLDEIIKPIKQNRAIAIAFLGMKKFNRASSMRSNNKDEIQLITRQIFNPAEITTLFAEIDSIKADEMREFIRTHALEQLNISSQPNQGGLK